MINNFIKFDLVILHLLGGAAMILNFGFHVPRDFLVCSNHAV